MLEWSNRCVYCYITLFCQFSLENKRKEPLTETEGVSDRQRQPVECQSIGAAGAQASKNCATFTINCKAATHTHHLSPVMPSATVAAPAVPHQLPAAPDLTHLSPTKLTNPASELSVVAKWAVSPERSSTPPSSSAATCETTKCKQPTSKRRQRVSFHHRTAPWKILD